MNVHKLRMDTSGNVEDISFVLAKKNGEKLGNITNIIDITAKHSMKEASEFTFTAYKQMDDNIIKFWNDIKDFKLVWIPEWDMWYEIHVEVNEKDENVKKVSGISLGEAELSQIMLYGIEINTETDIAREDYKIPTTFYNPDHPEASLMDRLLTDKAPHYKVKHIDKSLMNLQRTFTFDDTSIYDAFQEVSEELDCLFIFGCGSDENGKPERTISVYDLEANCVDCGNRDTFVHKCPKCGSTNIILGYGEYTNVFISRDNLADEITYSVDTDSVKNCMKLEAGDDLMTAAIRSCNPNGTDYIYYFPDETREEMSPELQEKLKSYDALYEKYQSDYNFTINDSFVTNYNALVNKYKTYEESLKDTEIKNPIVGYPKLMRIYFDTIDMVQLLRNKLMPPVDKPDNNAKSQGEYLMANLPSSASTTSLKNLSVSTADNIMVMLAQSIVKGVFKVTVTNTTLSNNVWKGKFNLENYSDKDDKFTSQFVSISINENYESYVKQRIDSILARSDENYYDIVGLFKQDMTVFKSQLKKYCLNTLQIFQKCCQSCIDMMVQQGISSNSTSSIYGINTKVLYENVYIPYYNKMNAIQDEIKVRENELYTVEGKYNNQNQLVQDGVQIEIERIITEVQDALNFKNYIGIDLYKEFSSFIRMDKFSNDNYISDGLNNTDLMKNAIEFITVATKELFKSATLQHSITGTIKNFLRMKEFEPVTNNFKNGNWICVGIDDKVYQLRIIEYEIDFSDTQNISVTFSDIIKLPDGMSYYERLEEVASKMATSYNGVVRQSTINTDFKNKMNEMIAKGLSMTNTKIVSNADNQDITWDEHGLLCREYDDIISDYTDSQLKIINHGIYITDDNWKTARAGIGNFIYYDPKDKTYKESYGVIADTLVSNLILTSEVGIYNEEKSIEMAKDGIIVTTNTMNKNVFTIRKEITDDEGNITYERQLYIDDNGNIRLAGNASIAWDSITGTENVVVKDTLNEFMATVKEQIDGKIDTFRQSDDPSVNWTDEEKKSHENDLWYDTTNNIVKMWNGSTWDDFTGDVPESVWNEINGKAQIFTDTPKTPYNKGDLWFVGENGIYIDAEHPNEYRNEILTCINPKADGTLFSINDWQKKNSYTDNSALNEFKNNVGYTQINSEWVISPNIKGGHLMITQNGSQYSAEITPDGKLKATGAEITGNITATSGIFTDVDIQSGKIGGFTLANNILSSSFSTISPSSLSYGSNFSVDSSGKLSANGATITGDINATSIYAKDSYKIYASGLGKSIKAIWCGDNWEPNDGYVDLYIGNDSKSWAAFIDKTSSDSKFSRRAIVASQYFNTGNRQNNYSSVNCVTDQDTTYVELTTISKDTPASVRLQIANDSGLCFIPGDVNDSALTYDETIKLGTKSHKWMQVWTKNLYANGDTVRFSGISAKSSTRYLVIDSNGNVGYRDGNNTEGGNASSYGSLTNKPQINGHTLVSGNNTLSDLGIAARSHSHSKLNNSSPVDYKGFGHCHTVIMNSNHNMWIAINNDGTPALTPYKLKTSTNYTDVDTYSLEKGGTCNLGSTDAPWNAVYAKNYYDEYGNKISTGGGSISLKIDGVTRSSGFTNYNLATQDWVTGKGYLTQHQSLSGYATTSWVKGAFGDTLSISGSTLYLKNYNGSQLSSVTLPTSSGGGNYAPLNHTHDHLTGSFDVTVGSSTMYPDGDGSYSCGSSGHRWKYVYASNGINTGSDEYIKENIKSITNFPSIDKFYMSLNPIQYKFKQRPNDDEISKIHFGFGARETERHLKENNFESENYSIVTKSILDKPNFVGRTDEYSMNYLEFISLNTHMTQKAHHRIDSLTQENQKLKNTILSLQGEIAIIKQKLEELA
ncbi:tail fiber domain-containing protein [Blautia wexlerae]|uniref:tail fiber domain-containing protein n=1 Tax=Blautia wexlerae TaxID=418240 RepID=UPI00189A0B76|nr:tail fiber domain-containing protein [Blautia wexlerae]